MYTQKNGYIKKSHGWDIQNIFIEAFPHDWTSWRRDGLPFLTDVLLPVSLSNFLIMTIQSALRIWLHVISESPICTEAVL